MYRKYSKNRESDKYSIFVAVHVLNLVFIAVICKIQDLVKTSILLLIRSR